MLFQDICAKQLLPDLCCPERVFVDVGAHIGSVIADVRRRHPAIKIIAIEAVPEKAADLARRFGDVQIHSCAVGETDGRVSFFVDDMRPGYSSLSSAGNSHDNRREISVSMRRLDDIIPATANVDVIKIDVEGAELGVLRGSTAVIDRCRPVVLFESGPRTNETTNSSTEKLFDWFAVKNYELFVPNRVAHEGPPLERAGFIECHFYPFRTLNFFALPAERRIEIRDRARKALGIVAVAK
jgi:FkbM family methyltransferase